MAEPRERGFDISACFRVIIRCPGDAMAGAGDPGDGWCRTWRPGHGGVCGKVSLRHHLERRWAPKVCATWSDSGDQEN